MSFLRIIRRPKSLYERLNIPPTTKTPEVLKKIDEFAKDSLIDGSLAKEINRFKMDRFNYDVIIELENKRRLSEDDPLPPTFFKPDTEAAIAKLKISEAKKENLRQSIAHVGFRGGTWIVLFFLYIWVCLRKQNMKNNHRNCF